MVDILIATYNGSKYLEALLDSLMCQTYTSLNIIARDDGSIDNTVEILNKYRDQYNGKMEIVSDAKNIEGAKGNFFNLLQHSKAEYVMFCDQDDVWKAHKVEKTLQAMQQAESKLRHTPLLVHTDLTVVDATLQPIHSSMFAMQKLDGNYNTLNRLLVQNNITGCTAMLNRSLADIIRPSADALMHDWWIGLCAAAFGKVVFLPEATILYRQHSVNAVGAKDVEKVSYMKEKISHRERVRDSIESTYLQASAFENIYGDMLSEEQKTMVTAYGRLGEMNLMQRFCTLNRYHLYKSGLFRKAAQILLG